VSVNRITYVVTPEQRQAAAAGLVQTREALPAMVKLQPGEPRELHGFGPKNEVFARGILRAMQAHPEIVPATLDVPAAQADLDALDALRPLLEAVRLLHAELEGTVALLGHDVMDFAYDGYQQLKLAGSADNALDAMRRDIGAQFTRRRRAEPAPEPAPAP
jgi:ABC-type proline/glycine betaine transport system ATPase subunit